MEIIAQPADLLLSALVQTPHLVVALSDERDMWERRVARARADGITIGREQMLAEITAEQRLAADHVVPLAMGPGYERLEVLRHAPPKWRGNIPDGVTGPERRRWLAHLPRPREFRPTPAVMARIRASWGIR